MSMLLRITTALVVATTVFSSATLHAEVRLDGKAGDWKLTRNGQPYTIKGVGGEGSWELLAKLGGNSVRTWGHEKLGEQLDLAQKLGLTVTAGIWLGQVRQGFDWSDAAGLIKQREIIRAAVMKHKNHPALLMWALGNEMEDPTGANGAVWSEINNLARMVKSLDPAHPTMTVVAELGGNKVRNFHELCPDVDILGINSYAGSASVGERYAKLGGTKPYILTEFGPPGIWEIKKDEVGAFRELSSTEKVDWYRKAYRASVTDNARTCLGSYAFMWGQKQEVTATWFSILLGDNTRLGAADALSELWTGKPVQNRVPVIESLAPSTQEQKALFAPGTTVRFSLKASDPERDPLKVEWTVLADEEEYATGGDHEAAAKAHSDAVLKSDLSGAEIRLPKSGGLYRISATVRDGKGGGAVANFPVRVDAPETSANGKPAKLPLVVYSEAEDASATYIPSGWMGNAKDLKLDPASKDRPKSGATCIRVEYSGTKDWCAVAWQNPAQDWGDKRGGYDLTGAKRLVFDARGETGGEEVTFGFGTIGKEKRYYDTAKRSLGKVTLTREWKEISLSLGDIKSPDDLTRIKTGFLFSVASNGKPVVFHLDNIRWE
jgi:hypothetical protein